MIREMVVAEVSMAGAHTDWATRFARHMLAAVLAYFVVLLIAILDHRGHRWDIEFYLSLVYLSVVLVPPSMGILKKIVSMIFAFYVTAFLIWILICLINSYDSYSDTFIIAGMALFNHLTLSFVLSYAFFHAAIERLSRRRIPQGSPRP